jgi:hypothetical protein
MVSKLLKFLLLLPTLLWAQVFTPGQILRTKIVDGFANNAILDAFSRLEIAAPYTLGDYIHRYDLSPLLFDTTKFGAGTITHLPNESAVRLRTTAASGDSVVFQSRRYHRYQAGKGGHVVMTCVPGAGTANVRKRWGFFDEKNGLFFQLSGTTFSVVQRSNASGAVVDSTITQANFNGDKVNGTGKSGMNLSFTKGNIFEIYFQWLGVGFASFRTIDSVGNSIEMHRFKNANRLTTVYTGTASLPIRYEQKTTAAASQADLIAICSSVSSSGGEDPPEFEFGFGRTTIVTTSSSSETFLIAFRPDSLFNSLINRSIVLPKQFLFGSDLSSCLFRVYYNGTITTTDWDKVSTGFSAVEYADTVSSFTVGKPLIYQPIIASGPITVEKSFSAISGVRKLALTRSATNKSYDNIIITVTRLTATNVDAMASMEWAELR